ncbi:MAG: hypothetical protein JO219_05215 [Candidatus Eremiobacteraeota bacterium]|nr:hypothetical protein [Candidatus Eremiobacteraeota bacterium]MBV8367172.1 hypothetical protein [Candidatus Eremiobacteraeota bacterium]
MKSAVIIVHGIGPLDRYQIQDQFAGELRDALNTETDDERRQRFGGEPPPRQGQWHADVIWPPVQRNQELEGVRPSAVRVHCDNRGVDVLQEPCVDVFEAYWSPADKGRTNAFSVLTWLLRSIFSPVADTRIAAPALKTAHDVAWVIIIALLVPALAVLSLGSAYRAYLGFETGTLRPLVALLVGLAGGYLVAQGLSRLVPLLFVSSAGRSTRRPVLLVVLGLAIVALTAWLAGGEYFDIFGRLGWLLVTTTSARLLLSLMIDFLDNRIGDIQIYATHNENESFFALREKILQIVGDTTLSVLRTKDGLLAKPLYDRVYLVGHSLGSSILMDVIIELHRLLMEGGLDESSWSRLRCFVSYGSALEKTHYLLGCARPRPPQQVSEFKTDLYSRLFSADISALRPASAATRPPMFWTNYWYFSDVVANAIASYGHARDVDQPPVDGTHYTCLNAQLPSPAGVLWSHNYYLNDRSVWHSAGERRGLATILAAS